MSLRGGDQTGGTGGPVNMVVASVNPADRAPRELPRGSRSGAFSAGPNATTDGGRVASGGSAAGLRAPNLTIQGPPNGSTTPGDGADVLRRLTRSGGFERLRPGEAPKIEARMLQALSIKPGDKVLEVGTGSGYVTAYLDWLSDDVKSIEIHESLSNTAREHLAAFGIKDVWLLADDVFDYPFGDGFDVIAVTGSLP